ncbi:MAG: SDR family NAD(P)-dependent oxidoreductase [Myxococcota bacterium]
MSTAKPVCVVTGVGPGNGLAISRRFAAAGYRVAMTARGTKSLKALATQVPGARGYVLDVGDPRAVAQAFTRIRAELGPVDVLVHNAGSAAFGSFVDMNAEIFETAFRTNALGLFLCAKEVVPEMLRAGRGCILVSGATAALRGGAGFAAFAPAKAAQRSLAQSMARSLGPQGIHVAYVVIDGVIDTPRTRSFLPDNPEDFFLKPEAIAETMYQLSQQDRSAWTFELDLRPFAESW